MWIAKSSPWRLKVEVLVYDLIEEVRFSKQGALTNFHAGTPEASINFGTRKSTV